MAEVTLKINNRGYGMSCDAGQEKRLEELAEFVDSRLQGIKASGAASAENHLLVLTSLVMADELFDLRDQLTNIQNSNPQVVASADRESEVANVIEHLSEKLERMNEMLNRSKAA